MLQKLANRPDEYQDYKFRTWKNLGYIDYVTMKEYAQSVYGAESGDVTTSLEADSPFYERFRADMQAKGYTVETQPVTDYLYAYKDIPTMTRVFKWYANLVQVDTPWRIHDLNNPDLKRGYHLTKDWSGLPALAASGTLYKYQIWIDGAFPFLHQNIIHLYMGRSYPSYDGIPVLEVIGMGQGRTERREITTTVNGEQTTFYTSIDEHTLKYKPELDRLDLNKFDDHYADGSNIYQLSLIHI